MTAEVVAEI